MRTNLALAGICALLTVSGVVFAQGLSLPNPPSPQGPAPSPQGPPTPAAVPAGDPRVITASEVEVRCGPSDKFYATSKLHRGDKVLVVGEAGAGWLKIKPPAPDSFSWVRSTFVRPWEKNPQTGVITCDSDSPVPVIAGSTDYKQEPTVEVAKLERGAQVVLQPGKQEYGKVGAMVAIAVTEREVRYIPAEAIASGTPARVVAREVPAAPNLQQTGGTAQTSKAQADQYLEAAKRYYQEALSDPKLSPAEKQQAWTVLQTLNSAQGAPQAIAATPGNPNNVAATQPQAQLVSRTSQPAAPTTGQTMALYITNPAATPPVAVPGANGQPQWSNWGVLRKTSFSKDGQAVYVLQTNQGVPIVYAVPETGKTLDRYVGSMIALYGSLTYPTDGTIRNYVMTVSYVAPPQ